MIAKKTKVKKASVVTNYKKAFPYCEPCAKIRGRYPVREIEAHHLHPGNDRSDEERELINVCREHHRLATPRDSSVQEAKRYNTMYTVIKYLKGEVTDDDLREWGEEEVILLATTLIVNPIYKNGKGLGWYAK